MPISFAKSVTTTLLHAVGTRTTVANPKAGKPLEFQPVAPDADEEGVKQAVNTTQRLVSLAFRALQTLPFLGGVYVRDVSFTSGADTTVTHRITDATVAWFTFRIRSGYPRFQEMSQTQGKIVLRADADCTADIFVFRVPSV